MRYIDLDLNKMSLSVSKGCDMSEIVSGSRNYLAVRLNCDYDWEMFGKVCVFVTAGNRQYPTPVVGNVAVVPDVLTMPDANIGLYVVGQNGDVRVTTNVVWLKKLKK